jgi:hypothetical protein
MFAVTNLFFIILKAFWYFTYFPYKLIRLGRAKGCYFPDLMMADFKERQTKICRLAKGCFPANRDQKYRNKYMNYYRQGSLGCCPVWIVGLPCSKSPFDNFGNIP